MIYNGHEINVNTHLCDIDTRIKPYQVFGISDYIETKEHIKKQNEQHRYVIILIGDENHADSIIETDENPKCTEEIREIIRDDKRAHKTYK